MKYLVFDINNLLFRTFYANKDVDQQTTVGLALHSALTTVNSFYNEFKPDKLIAGFDSKSWRKVHTESDKCVSKKIYKGQRRQNMTPAEKQKYLDFLNHLGEFERLISEHSTIVTLKGDGLEFDDVVAQFCKTYHDGNEISIVSSDKDMLQLLRYKSVKLIDPATRKEKTLEDWQYDADLFLYELIIRGDRADNLMSAFPRVRKTKILEAYNDEFKHQNMMNETWQDASGNTYRVGDLFEENKLLMDLTKQPTDIQQKMLDVVTNAMEKQRKFSFFHFMKFLGKYDLNKIADQAETFVKMLSR